MNNILIRDLREDDIPFICDSMWRSSKQTQNMATIKQLVYDKNTQIKIACLPGDERVIIGYKINNGFIYVKVAFRNLGVKEELECSH
jgi:hypothetical protein